MVGKRSRLAVVVLAALIFTQSAYTASALLAPYNEGYFLGNSFSGGIGDVISCNLSNPINNTMTNKATFIAAIKNYRSTGNNGCGGLSAFDINRNQTGAEFVIQTMRGVSATATRPTNADVVDWENRINNPSVTLEWDASYPYTVNSGYQSGAHDDDMFVVLAGTRPSLIFKQAGTIIYALKADCANPVGDLPGLPVAMSWTVTPKSTVSATEVFPGETVDFKHYVKNNGPDTASGVRYAVQQRVDGTVSGYKAMTGPIAAMASGSEPNVTNDTYTPTQADVGKVYCRRTNAEPSAYGGSSTVNGAWACVTVKSNYDLFPQTPQPGGTPEPLMVGDTRVSTDIKGYVWNNGATADRDIPYEIHQFVVTGASKPVFDNTKFPLSTAVGATTVIYAEGSHNNGAACSSWMSSNFPMITCNAAPLATGTSMFPGGQSPALPGFKDINADDYKPGDWICQFLSVGLYRYNINDPQAHRIGVPMCMVIAKQPALQVWGSDMRVGNGILSKNDDASVITSTFASGGATFGSWAEYGIFAPRNATNTLGKIDSVSGGAISGTAGLTTPPSASHLSKLSFANINSPYGRWAPAQLVASIKQAVQVQAYPVLDAPGASINVWTDSLTSKGKLTVAKLSHTDGSGNPAKVSIRGVNAGGTKLSLPDGGSLLMYSDESVSIDSDIILTEQTITELGQASQVIVIAKNIIISSAVKQLDAWLVAIPAADGTGGTITTCDSIADTGSGLYYFNGLRLGDDCEDNQLRINGAVIAKELQLRRSFGADKIAGVSQPAEIINLRPDAYMWGMLPTSTPANAGLPIRTMITTELPPRF